MILVISLLCIAVLIALTLNIEQFIRFLVHNNNNIMTIYTIIM